MVNDWQQFCLSMIGIDQWVLKAPASGICVYLGLDTTFPLTPKATSLLNAILKYKGLTLSQVGLTQHIEQLYTYDQIWIFGLEGPLPQEVCESKVMMRAQGLQQLLDTPLKKKEILFYRNF